MSETPESPPLLVELRGRARGSGQRLVLPESSDSRILAAAIRAAQEDLCQPVLIGAEERIRASAEDLGLRLPTGLEILDPDTLAELPAWIEELRRSLRERKIPADGMEQRARDPLWLACLLVLHGRCDGAVMGAVATTTDTLRAAIRVIGVAPDHGVVTSCFLMALPDGRVLIYADGGVIPKPTAPQLADIATLAAGARRLWVGDEPRVALLSFSTLGSARHPVLDPVLEALGILHDRKVDFPFDGELQADAALVPSVAAQKAPDSAVAGSANVLVFPDLNSGNIAYKLTERLAGARAVGPLLLGLRGPVHDLSRGCSVDDIIDTLAITALQAQGLPLAGSEARR
ncbi:MAG: phosphotransacetylase [Holophagales bacterium]|nr:phosphotransacetylase [Holophagales bacterium]